MRPTRSIQRKFVVPGVLSAACWGLGTILSKGLLVYVPPLNLLVVQLIASLIFLWTLVVIQHQLPPLRWEVLRLGLTGFLEPGLSYILLISGLSLTSASNASLLSMTEPIMLIGLAWLLLGEQITAQFILLASLAFIGMVLIVGMNPTVSSNHSFLGDLLICMGTFCGALYGVVNRRLVVKLNPLPLTALQQTAGLLLILTVWQIGLPGGETEKFLELSPSICVVAAASGIVQYSLGIWLYLTVLREMQAKMASLFLMLIPIFGVSGAYLFLGEQLTVTQLLGAAIILVVVITLRKLQYRNKQM